MQTLARMTGKDFSGPTPEIRARTPLRMPDQSGKLSPDIETLDKLSGSAALDKSDEEILGEIDNT